MTFSLIRGDATSIPLADDSVDLVVTSPPYFALRSYTDGGEHYDGQIEWRCEDPKMRAKVLGVKAPSPQLEGQGVLL